MGSAEFLTQLPAALATLATLAVLAAAVFGRATHPDRENDIDIDIGIQGLQTAERELAAQIEDLLPQTQCGQCGHPGCRPYARAVAAGEPFNKCPPGGHATIAAIADLLGTPPLALDPEHGREGPKLVAYIREAECIGCTKCLPACPVDAILGAPRQMHTVIAAECTGCDLCVEPCPVDCIEMIPAPVRSALMARGQLPPVAA
ncbi:MAG: electron transport complex subunit RsxB [Porticoccaceae bacterium]|nr:MAG: electron transport complex subunit RsxB [Porticoccaceae bacterium]